MGFEGIATVAFLIVYLFLDNHFRGLDIKEVCCYKGKITGCLTSHSKDLTFYSATLHLAQVNGF